MEIGFDRLICLCLSTLVCIQLAISLHDPTNCHPHWVKDKWELVIYGIGNISSGATDGFVLRGFCRLRNYCI